MRIISYLFLLAMAIFGMTFSALNSAPVTINYYFSEKTLPLSLLMVLVFAMGATIGMGTALWLLFKTRLQMRHIKQKLSVAEKEIKNLRTMPLQDAV